MMSVQELDVSIYIRVFSLLITIVHLHQYNLFKTFVGSILMTAPMCRLPGACRVHQGEVHRPELLRRPLQQAGGDGEGSYSLHPAGALLLSLRLQVLRHSPDQDLSRPARSSDDRQRLRQGDAGQEPRVPAEAVPGLCVSTVALSSALS